MFLTNCQISKCLTSDIGFISTNVLFSIPTLQACVNAHGGQFQHFLLKLSSFVSVSEIIILKLSEFHVKPRERLVCYNVDELRCDAKL